MYRAPDKEVRMYDRGTRMYDRETCMYRAPDKEACMHDRETVGLVLLALKEGTTQKEAANCAVHPRAR